MNEGIPFLTIQDKMNAALLEGNDIPCLIVEGTTDVLIYEKLLANIEIGSELDIIIGESKSNVKKFIEDEGDEVSFPYLAILDSDYERYLGCCLSHNNVVYTHSYTMENYITSNEVIEEVIRSFTTLKTRGITANKLLEDIINSIKPFIFACLGKLENGWAVKLEDIGLETWGYRNGLQVDQAKLLSYLKEQLKVDLEDELNNYEVTLNKLIQTDQLTLVLSGKRIYDALYWRFKKIFPKFMDGKSKRLFERELYCYIHYDSKAQELRSYIENHFKQYTAALTIQ
ncbi:DUF4435 domain-containing protein [Bacillus cereus]|uniref:DUF4435 domain-containing protein n=1 Tax=Bacillus thuringiensis TaxID=1428 RepID=UPI000676C27F|nr:DUF4435 domain-containing protein [Bacillus thuringiensis]MEB8878428.1 DUF4435 domain-containing protein [Bacillus cereus]AKR38647.1 Hypothetical protein NF53_p3085 [Bacillus thuringiensis serovar indiana]MBG9643384.1 hypothetical protein [Bacillus thuringiensis]MBG9649552.1 hypothetical protein [Bacillus thuringiensis]MEB9619509.1 DUF4435 domain-containing protein [Bacillus cereus]